MSFEIMSYDKYPCIFSLRMKAIVFVIHSNIFHNTCSFEHWGISLGYCPVLAVELRARDAFEPVLRERKYLMDYNNH